MAQDTAPAELGFDPDALREKYRQERDKRLRADGNAQYLEITGEYAHYIEDPYVQPDVREPVTSEVEVAVVGGGHGGLQIGARLRMAGVQSIRLIEKGGDFGGTWYWNRYPGAACDTEAYIYMPLLEETGYVPTEKYAKAPEIRAHCQRIAQHFDLYRDVLFQTQITEVRWQEDAQKWLVATDRGDRFLARFIAMANGPLNRPKLPGVPGIESFKGHSFHTSRWDYDYTGGDSYGNLTGLADKRVAIIGTGATAIQAIPHLGASAKALFVFQRTPSSVDIRANRATDPEWAKSLQPGWQRHRMENFSTVLVGGQVEEDLVSDGWTEIITKLLRGRVSGNATDGFGGGGAPDALELGKVMEMADFEKMNQIRARADATVHDKTTAEALKPYYRQFCKRPCFHDEYLPTFNRPNVTLVNTDGKGIDRITEKGVVANGQEYEVDCIIYASGFEVGTPLERRAGYEVYGKGGLTLSDKWKDGVATLHGMQTRGFPNCFIVGLAQVGGSANITHVLDVQSRHIAYVIESALERGAETVDVVQEAEDAWVDTIIRASMANITFLENCTPGYYNNEGQPNGELIRQNGAYAPGIMAFSKLLDAWKAEGSLSGLEFAGG
ncbi:NAD(P)/FAD-dependent oxidoreductase [Candidatus Amarobacter glycogenicus]|uniref:flavin-containing monooxygenase n=1 Tax=Candidatus Amarobacter glycogenicus TaxID=3140699 RepID=UPI0031355C51|nr:NAD(P)/FAD-dependent oxidoreductase [Dehalococcoidia bacterium]